MISEKIKFGQKSNELTIVSCQAQNQILLIFTPTKCHFEGLVCCDVEVHLWLFRLSIHLINTEGLRRWPRGWLQRRESDLY